MTISIRLPAEVETRLQNLATITGRSKSFYVTQAILEHLDDLENLYFAEYERASICARISTSIQTKGSDTGVKSIDDASVEHAAI